MSDTSQVLLQHHLKKLRLPTFLSEYAKLAQQCAAGNNTHADYLLRLCELELPGGVRRHFVNCAHPRAGVSVG